MPHPIDGDDPSTGRPTRDVGQSLHTTMNLICPACGAKAMSMLRKMSSSPVFPRRCRDCGEMVAPQRTFVLLLVESATSQVAILGGAVIAFFMWSWWPLAAGILADVVVTPLFYWQTPLIIVTAEQRFRWRAGAIIGIFVFVALVVLAGITDG